MILWLFCHTDLLPRKLLEIGKLVYMVSSQMTLPVNHLCDQWLALGEMMHHCFWHLVISWMLILHLSLFIEFKRMKCFCAWLATCVGVLVTTKFRDILHRSHLPYFSGPRSNYLVCHKKKDLINNRAVKIMIRSNITV